MSENPIFFSYSRDDAEFVECLAKALKEAGVSVWLDSMDIEPGARWDDSIEAALNNAEKVLLVFTKTSVSSQNVMDEVSYAIEEGKGVVPILLEQCDIPFRLRRFQFTDFTKSYEEGIDMLSKALNVNRKIAKKLSCEYTGGAATEALMDMVDLRNGVKPHGETQAEARKRRKANKPKNWKVPVMIVAGLAIVALGIWQVPKLLKDEDKIAFEAALEADTREAYQNYLSTYSQGKFALRVNDSLNKRTEQELIAQEDESWRATTDVGDKTAYNMYLRDYPQGRYVPNANDSIAKIDNNRANIEADNLAWNTALGTKSVTGYLDYYMNEEVIGLHREEALKMVDQIAEVGYLFNGKNNDGKMSNDRIFDLLCCGEEISQNGVPKVGDILLTTQTRFTYRDEATNYRNSQTVKADDKVLVLEIINPSSNNVIVKIAY